MRLTNLEPQFLRIDNSDESTVYHHVDAIVDADGLRFQCPKCYAKNGGPIGTHYVVCWRPRVPQTEPPTPGRWELIGTSYVDLSLVAGSSSVQITGGCSAHFFVRDGAIVMV